jgi:serine phosphatase RsbU (regulator of sigma subunit)
MYFGNNNAVLEYDGTKWVSILVSNNSIVRSLSIDNNGTIYVGAVGELGFLVPDKKGILIYKSLMDKLPKEEREFADVWKTYTTPDGVYFQTFSKLIRIQNNSIKIWKPETSFHFSYFINGKLYINERERGLKCISGDKLISVEGGEIFSGLRIYSMLPYFGDKIILATREKGLILMNQSATIRDSVFKFLNVQANQNLIGDQVYSGVRLANGNYAYATLKNGVLLIDSIGDIHQIFNKKSGIQDDIVKFVNTDSQGDLWMALGNGISRVEISNPLTSINDGQGLKGFIEDIIEYNNSIFVCTSLGVFSTALSKQKNKSEENKCEDFSPIKGIESQAWALLKFVYKEDTVLLASAESGIFSIKNSISNLIHENFGYVLYHSKINPERVFIGTHDGLSSMRYENKHWVNEDYFNGIDKEIRAIAEDSKGTLWLGTPFDGLIKINFFPNEKTSKDSLITSWHTVYKINYYSVTSGLPETKDNYPYNFNDKVIFATSNGVFEFNEETNRFLSSSFLTNELKLHQVYRFVPRGADNVWLSTYVASSKKETGVAILQKNNSYSWYSQPFLRVSDREIHAIFPDDNDITWFGGPDGLLRYDANVKKDFSQPFYSLIRMVVAGKDSVFGGNFYKSNGDYNISVTEQPDSQKLKINYSDNSLQFEFAATSFGSEKNNLFNVYLEGNDNDWSGWTNKTEKGYTNLKEGNYTFHVKAKNIYGTESVEATYQFKILPPWYRTVWAYIVYVVAFIGFVYLIIRLSVRRLVKAKEKLEETVKERTAEVVSQKHLIEEKHKEITDSINYAERIQRSFLATKELLDENLSSLGGGAEGGGGYFVFFQPKDVVSGDFYWAGKLKNDLFALVTADSTGHGVPGAIMSLLNITSLEKAVEQSSNPASILTRARKTIIERLKKDGSAEGGKDGMDCSIICFDFKNNKFTYAAANNPVWLVRGNELLEFDPDKMPVGKHDRDSVPFSQSEVALQKGDVVYALTDGMPDQFGGPKGKKFMYKRLKEFLVSISHLPMNEQKEQIKKALNDWKGDLEQVDDVCLIGVRF